MLDALMCRSIRWNNAPNADNAAIARINQRPQAINRSQSSVAATVPHYTLFVPDLECPTKELARLNRKPQLPFASFVQRSGMSGSDGDWRFLVRRAESFVGCLQVCDTTGTYGDSRRYRRLRSTHRHFRRLRAFPALTWPPALGMRPNQASQSQESGSFRPV
jgi:hypothetical protein